MNQRGSSEDRALASKVLIEISVQTSNQAESGRQDAASICIRTVFQSRAASENLPWKPVSLRGGMTIKKLFYKEGWLPFWNMTVSSPVSLFEQVIQLFLHFFFFFLSYNCSLGVGGSLNIQPEVLVGERAFSEQYCMDYRHGGAIHSRLGGSRKEGNVVLSYPRGEGAACPGEVLQMGRGDLLRVENSNSCWFLW